jgi:hypothetical protein
MAITIVIHQFASIRSALGIPHGINLQGMLNNILSTTVNHIFGQTHVNTAVVALFWALVGIFVYALVIGFTGGLREFGSDMAVQSYLWPKDANPHSPLVGFIERIGVHLLALLVLFLYVIGPLSIILHGPVLASGALASNTLVLDLIWFIVGTVVWHGLTIALRLLLLRPRLLR